MKRNVGESIQAFATFFGIIGVVCSIILGILGILATSAGVKGAVASGLVDMVLGIVVSVASSKVMYGFGIIVYNNERQISQDKKAEGKVLEKQAKQQLADAKLDENDENNYIDVLCPYCEENISYTKKEFIENESLTCPECYESFDTKLFK